MSFTSGMRTWSVLGWVCIICFASTVSIAASQGVMLEITPNKVATKCGDNVTLTCKAPLPPNVNIKLFAWVAGNKTVCKDDSQLDTDVLCVRTAETLSLILNNVMPVNQGKYICKLWSNNGAYSSAADVTVQNCFGSSASFINESLTSCRFSGLYPSGTIHWLQEGLNLTDFTSTKEEVDQHGRYNLLSTLDVKKGNSSQAYNCSLWIPSIERYVSSAMLNVTKPMTDKSTSSGSMVKLQWISIVVEIMMVKFMA